MTPRGGHPYFRPESLEDAWRIKADVPDALYIAGGTDVFVKQRDGRREPGPLISLRNIAGLDGVELAEDRPGSAQIGASCTVSSLLGHRALMAAYPLLGQAACRLGSVQIRNSATIAGNLCNASPCADLAPPLLALEAKIKIAAPGTTREVPLEQFFIGPKQNCLAPLEIVTGVEVPAPTVEARGVVLRHSRVRMDLALVSVAALLRFDDGVCVSARIAAGAVSPYPMRLRGVEEALEGRRVDEPLLAALRVAAAEEVTPISDVRTTAAYRRHMTGVFVERAIRALLEQGDA